VFVALVPFEERIRTWKVWERGAPQVAVEIISDSDAPELPWNKKLARYQRLGVHELVRFEPEESRPLRVWDRVEGTLSERVVTGRRARSLVLELDWVVAPAAGLPCALRIEQAARNEHALHGCCGRHQSFSQCPRRAGLFR
jgi:Uma2 family endonuclease